MTLHDQLISYIRTYVPYGVGIAAAWLLATFALTIPDDLVLAITAFLVVAAQNVYYLAIRLAERYVPWLGVFLGWPKQPDYLGMSNLWASVLRTGIPTVIGGLIGLIIALGLNLDPQTQSLLAVALIGVAQALYYGAARWLTARVPALEWMLGDTPAPDSYALAA